jgi:hypothetical protein
LRSFAAKIFQGVENDRENSGFFLRRVFSGN